MRKSSECNKGNETCNKRCRKRHASKYCAKNDNFALVARSWQDEKKHPLFINAYNFTTFLNLDKQFSHNHLDSTLHFISVTPVNFFKDFSNNSNQVIEIICKYWFFAKIKGDVRLVQVKLLALKTKKGELVPMEAAEGRRDQTTD